MKNFILQKMPNYQLEVQVKDCDFPTDLTELKLIQQHLDSTGMITSTHTNQFFLSKSEIQSLVAVLIDR